MESKSVAKIVGFAIAAYLVSGVLAVLSGGIVLQQLYPKWKTPGMLLAPMVVSNNDRLWSTEAFIDTLCWFALICIAYCLWRKFRGRSQSNH